MIIGDNRAPCVLLHYFSMGKDRCADGKTRKLRAGKLVHRDIFISLEEASVKKRKMRTKCKTSLLDCLQTARVSQWLDQSSLPRVRTQP